MNRRAVSGPAAACFHARRAARPSCDPSPTAPDTAHAPAHAASAPDVMNHSSRSTTGRCIARPGAGPDTRAARSVAASSPHPGTHTAGSAQPSASTRTKSQPDPPNPAPTGTSPSRSRSARRARSRLPVAPRTVGCLSTATSSSSNSAARSKATNGCTTRTGFVMTTVLRTWSCGRGSVTSPRASASPTTTVPGAAAPDAFNASGIVTLV